MTEKVENFNSMVKNFREHSSTFCLSLSKKLSRRLFFLSQPWPWLRRPNWSVCIWRHQNELHSDEGRGWPPIDGRAQPAMLCHKHCICAGSIICPGCLPAPAVSQPFERRESNNSKSLAWISCPLHTEACTPHGEFILTFRIRPTQGPISILVKNFNVDLVLLARRSPRGLRLRRRISHPSDFVVIAFK